MRRALLALYRDTALSMAATWWGSQAFNHGFLIVPIALYLAWSKRAEIAKLAPAPDYLGFALLALAGFAWLAGASSGVVLLLAGLARLRWLASRAAPVHDGPWADAARDVARQVVEPVLDATHVAVDVGQPVGAGTPHEPRCHQPFEVGAGTAGHRSAQRPSDIVTTMSGQTVEVLNTEYVDEETVWVWIFVDEFAPAGTDTDEHGHDDEPLQQGCPPERKRADKPLPVTPLKGAHR